MKKHLQENTAVAGTAQNKGGVHFQEENKTGIQWSGCRNM